MTSRRAGSLAGAVGLACLLTACRSFGAPAITWEPDVLPAEGARGAIVLQGGEVLATRTGPVPGGVGVICSRSSDGGRTWQRLAVIVSDPDAKTDLGDGCLLRRAGGGLLYAYRDNHYRGAHASSPSYAIRVAASADGGVTWRAHSTVMETHPAGQGPSRGLWAPCLFETRRGALQCYYDDEYTPFEAGFRGHQWLRMKTWDAKTFAWRDPVTVSRAHDPAHLSRDGMASVVELPGGRLLCALESVQTDSPHANLVRAVTSDDGGRTWSWQRAERAVIYQPADRRYGALSPSLTRLPDGRLLCAFVTDEDRAAPYRSGTPVHDLNMDAKCVLSRDGARTWSASEMICGETHRAYMPCVLAWDRGARKDEVLALVLDTRKGFVSRRGHLRP